MLINRPSNRALILVVGFVRVSAAFLLYWNIFWGWVLSAILDIVDCPVLMQWGTLTSAKYQQVDKVMDLLVQLVMLAVTIKSPYFGFLLVLYLHRFIGQVVFWKTSNDKFLILFPNIFEAFWLWLICIPLLRIPFLTQPIVYVICLVILITGKMIQELIVHKFGGLRTVVPWASKLIYENSYSLSKRFI